MGMLIKLQLQIYLLIRFKTHDKSLANNAMLPTYQMVAYLKI